MAALTIDAAGLRKDFGARTAVRDLTLQVERGEAFGFLGPNGAGKSTSIKMLLGLVKPTSGRALLLGQPAGSRDVRARIGFLPEHFRFYDWLTAPELLMLHGRLCGIADPVLRQRIPKLLERVGLAAQNTKPIRSYSKGMMQRVGALSLIWLQAVLLISVTIAFSTRLSALTIGACTLGLYGLAFVGGWIEQFGAIRHVRACVNLGILASLVMPSDALWRRAASKVQPPLLGAAGVSPFNSSTIRSPAMVVYAAVYTLIALVLAQIFFERRDL
jgi:ABC-type transport system involved in cytochrome c biogenesis ATPase subunit